MGLNRVALRLAAIEALAPTGATTFPTLAGNRIYDTAPAIFNLEAGAARIGFAQVTTEDASSKPAGTGRDLNQAREERCRLAIEITYGKPRIGDTGVEIALETDATATAMLDYFEYQVLSALDHSRKTGGILAKACLNFEESASEQAMDADTATPLAVRRITIECRIPRLGKANLAGEGFDRLPEPLRSVAKALPEASYGAPISSAIAALIAASTSPVPLETLALDARLFGQAEGENSAIAATITL